LCAPRWTIRQVYEVTSAVNTVDEKTGRPASYVWNNRENCGYNYDYLRTSALTATPRTSFEILLWLWSQLMRSPRRGLPWLLLLLSCSDATGPLEPEGRIVFASSRDLDWNIYTVNQDGSDVQRITPDTSLEIQPAFSTSRSRIAFYSERTPRGIYLMDADGSNVRFLCAVQELTAEHLRWSPDDQRIAFQGGGTTHSGGGVYVVDTVTGQSTLIKPSGKSPDWTADGQRLAFHIGNLVQIGTMKVDGSDVKSLLIWAFDPAMSPDGKSMAYANALEGEGGIWIANADGTSPRRLTMPETNDYHRAPVWSRDGRAIAFARLGSRADVFTIRPDGTGLRPVTFGPGAHGPPSW
jgi:Tol biopolymer transport system component